MTTLANLMVGVVAIQHLGFLVLEMFLWKKPVGLRVFRMTLEQAETSAVLAANQGLYNGFLAAGLLLSFVLGATEAHLFRMFFLSCVIVAGLYGAWTVSRRIFFLQAMPAILALTFVVLSRNS